MVKLEDAVIARFEFKEEKFEILVDPDLAMKLKKGESVSFNDLLAIDTVFKDASKGTTQGSEALKESFGTDDVNAIAKKIITQGEVQLTTEQRRQMREQRRKEVIELIARNCLNPQTNAPHPPQRIENALNEIKAHIDESKSAEEQVPVLVKEMRKLIPLSFEKLQMAVKVPAAFSGKASSVLHKYDLKNEQWQGDGSLVALVELPAGLKAEFLNELNHLTHGDIEVKLLGDKK